MSKIVVLGGAGAMGQIIVQDLAEYSDAQVVIADFNQTKAEALRARLNNDRISAAFADIKDQSALAKLLAGASVLINSTPYYHNLTVMQAALAAGCNYLDLGGLFHVTRKQLELDAQFKQKDLLAVLGMGAAPGMTNVMAAAGAEQLDKIDSIDISIGAVDFVELDQPFTPPYALDTIFDEYTMEPMVFENGKFQARPPMSGERRIEFPAPVGRTNAILTLHSEVATLPLTYAAKGIKAVYFRLGLPIAFHEKMKFLVELGFGQTAPVETAEGAFVPRKVLAKLLERFPTPEQEPDDCEVVRVEVTGHKSGRETVIRLETTVFSDSRWKVSSGALDTGVPPAIVAQMITKGQISHKGVLAPEACIPIKPFFAELAKRSIEIHTDILEVEPAATG